MGVHSPKGAVKDEFPDLSGPPKRTDKPKFWTQISRFEPQDAHRKIELVALHILGGSEPLPYTPQTQVAFTRTPTLPKRGCTPTALHKKTKFCTVFPKFSPKIATGELQDPQNQMQQT